MKRYFPENTTKAEIVFASDILGEAFSEDPFITKVLSHKTVEERVHILSKVYGHCCQYSLSHGSMFLNDERTACAILLPKSDIILRPERIFKSGLYKSFLYLGPTCTAKLEIHEQQMCRNILRSVDGLNVNYIWSLGTKKASKGSGLGRKILEACDLHAKNNSLDALVLKTKDPNNISFYEKFGFKLVLEDENKILDLKSWIFIKHF